MIRVATCAECMQADVPKWRDEGGGEFCLDHAYAHVWVLVETMHTRMSGFWWRKVRRKPYLPLLMTGLLGHLPFAVHGGLRR
jgi:hypothetical protein